MLHVDELEREGLPDFDPAPDDIEDVDGDETVDPYDAVTDEGDVLPDEVQAELEALAAAELETGSEMEQALAEAQREIARQRTLTRQAVARYRAALLAAEPDLPPDLVQGETLDDVEASAEAARATVARIQERIHERMQEPERPRGFPVGAPARSVERPQGMTSHEKIAAGLQERLL